MECKFTQGFVAACAATLSNHGCDTIVADTLVCCGPVSVDHYRKLGVEEYDITILRPIIKEIQRKKKCAGSTLRERGYIGQQTKCGAKPKS
jgi:hypothetical protein